jgi:hypothetical protein
LFFANVEPGNCQVERERYKAEAEHCPNNARFAADHLTTGDFRAMHQ